MSKIDVSQFLMMVKSHFHYLNFRNPEVEYQSKFFILVKSQVF